MCLTPASEESQWIEVMGRKPAASYPLLDPVPNLGEPGSGAVLVQIAARCTGSSERADHFVVDLDHDAASEQEQMRKLREQRGDRGRLRSLDKSTRVGLERGAGVGFVCGAIERVCPGTVTAQDCLTHPIGVDQHRGLAIALSGAGRDRLADRFQRERRGDAMGLQCLREQRLAPDE